MTVRSVAFAWIIAVSLTGCGQAHRVLSARVDADRLLLRDRTADDTATIQLRNGQRIRAWDIDLLPERTSWTSVTDEGDSLRVDAPTVSIRSIRMSADRRPLWKHMIAGAALGVLVGGVLAEDFGDGSDDATLFLWGGVGAAAGGLGSLAGGRDAVYPVVGGVEVAAPPP